jgi:MFS family permease
LACLWTSRAAHLKDQVMQFPPTPQPPDASRPDRRGAFFLLFFALMVIGSGNTMLIGAVLPPMTRALEMPDWMAGAVFAFSALLWSLCSPYWGRLSNRKGRRPIAALGLAGYGVSMTLLWLTGYLALAGVLTGAFGIFLCFAIGRAVFGFVGSAANPAAQAYVADRTSRAERQSEIAFLSSGFSVGSVIGPAFAAALIGWGGAAFGEATGLLAPLAITAILAFIMSALVWYRLPEDRAPVSDAIRVETDIASKGLWRSGRVLPFLIFALGMSIVSGVLTQVFVFTVMDRMDATGTEAAQFTGPAFTVGALAVLLAQLALIPRLKLPNRTLMWVGCLPLLLGAVILVFAHDYGSLIFAQFCIGLGGGLSRPGFSSGASLAVSPQLQGNVAGLVISANGLGFVITPLLGLFIYEYVSPVLPYIFCAVLLAIMALYARYGIKEGLGEPREDDLDGNIHH